MRELEVGSRYQTRTNEPELTIFGKPVALPTQTAQMSRQTIFGTQFYSDTEEGQQANDLLSRFIQERQSWLSPTNRRRRDRFGKGYSEGRANSGGLGQFQTILTGRGAQRRSDQAFRIPTTVARAVNDAATNISNGLVPGGTWRSPNPVREDQHVDERARGTFTELKPVNAPVVEDFLERVETRQQESVMFHREDQFVNERGRHLGKQPLHTPTIERTPVSAPQVHAPVVAQPILDTARSRAVRGEIRR